MDTKDHAPNPQLTAETEAGILKARARELAREPAAAADDGDAFDVIEFGLAGETYGLELAFVREVCALKEITPVPCTPPFITGIVNLRGEIQTVIDLRNFLSLPAPGITPLNQIILIEDGRMQLGILADAIRHVRRVRSDEMQPALVTMTGIIGDYVRGVCSDHVTVLDAGKILSDKRLIVDEQPPA